MEKMAKSNTLLVHDTAGGAPDLDSNISANEMWDAAHEKKHKSRAQQARERQSSQMSNRSERSGKRHFKTDEEQKFEDICDGKDRTTAQILSLFDKKLKYAKDQIRSVKLDSSATHASLMELKRTVRELNEKVTEQEE